VPVSVVVIAVAPLVRAGLAQLVRESERLVLAGSAAALRSLAFEDQGGAGDVLLVQVDRQDEEHDQVASALAVGVPVVMLTDANVRERAWRARATVLPTAASDREIIAAVEAAAAGLVSLTASHAEQLAQPSAHVSPSTRTEWAEPLTPREGHVLHLLAEGLANRDIGARLGISAHTAKFHVGQILAKLSAATRAEAVAIGWRSGLLARANELVRAKHAMRRATAPQSNGASNTIKVNAK